MVLFNGEPRIGVRLGPDGVFRWATQKTGRLSSGSKKFLRQFMARNSYKYYIVRVSRAQLEELVSG